MANGGIDSIKLHENQTTVSTGHEWNINYGASTINIIVSGTATSFEAKFEGKLNGIWSPIMGVSLNDLKLASSATVKNIMYQLDLTGVQAVRCNLTSVVGGNVTIYGWAVD